MIKLTFDIPPVPQARPRARHIPAKMARAVTSMGIKMKHRKGKTYLYDRKDVKIFKGQLGMLARNQYKGEPLDEPLMVSLHFYRLSAKVSKKELARRYSGQEPHGDSGDEWCHCSW
ncbi:RusA family crossover junction endodeoxyribonuclease [uncultured Limosilactobacillus sp.]|uniref:RusA family crossover junction endodeoxyribonuclease n=1 Tax=uncultured Limosilactobacillus sp. TaxID=2837629 RepID=UPI0025F25361|nr:RusA family crossover junction endodeoxyribonuclease [uncultured Limosilactobacillus sp.]